MAVHVFCRGVGDDVGAPFERAAVDWSREGVVNDKRNSVGMGDPGKPFNVKDFYAGVGDAFSEQELCFRPDGGFDLFIRRIRVDEGDIYP